MALLLNGKLLITQYDKSLYVLCSNSEVEFSKTVHNLHTYFLHMKSFRVVLVLFLAELILSNDFTSMTKISFYSNFPALEIVFPFIWYSLYQCVISHHRTVCVKA